MKVLLDEFADGRKCFNLYAETDTEESYLKMILRPAEHEPLVVLASGFTDHGGTNRLGIQFTIENRI